VYSTAKVVLRSSRLNRMFIYLESNLGSPTASRRGCLCVTRLASTRRIMQTGAGVAVLLAVQLLAAPRAAWAGCNHGVLSRSRAAQSVSRLDAIFDNGSPLAPTDKPLPPGQHGSPNEHRPCIGLSCSSPSPLPGSSATSQFRDFDQWGALDRSRFDRPAMRSFAACVPPVSPRSADRSAVFHPPRAAV
jgi:hypothetical protein